MKRPHSFLFALLSLLAALLVFSSSPARADDGCPPPAGGCNQYGCWNTPAGSCNQYGCRDVGGCNQYGCWNAPGGGCNQYGCWNAWGAGCNQYGCWGG